MMQPIDRGAEILAYPSQPTRLLAKTLGWGTEISWRQWRGRVFPRPDPKHLQLEGWIKSIGFEVKGWLKNPFSSRGEICSLRKLVKVVASPIISDALSLGDIG
ncbi:hypothetical protein DSO57_1002172 [Entomophthora muscae]|uniref:Uncharacterized protein n=1 Tax=Entomophthora muscae TaxID=34485 RepID=A0ACC2T929_9FUNG|nr:hypothetical protein DSO57_1002172 [Entomophthora muscae]